MNESAVTEKILKRMPIAIGLIAIALMLVGIASATNYAVLINGGVKANENEAAFWNDIVFVYDTLLNFYGYNDADIFVLYSDGKPPNIGNCRNPGDAMLYPNPIIDFPATAGNLQAVFSNLSDKKDIEKLVVYITNHGGGNDFVKKKLRYSKKDEKKLEDYITNDFYWQEDTENINIIEFDDPEDKRPLKFETANFALWDNGNNQIDYFGRDDVRNEVVFDFEFAGMAYLGQIDGEFTRRFILDFCHSGGFIDDLSMTDTVIATACEPYKNAYIDVAFGKIEFSIFTYYYISALNFGDPSGIKVNADANGDKRCSLTEAFNWAAPRTTKFVSVQIPLFDDNGDRVGHSAWLPKERDGKPAPAGLGDKTYLCTNLSEVRITAKQLRNVVAEGDEYEIEGIANAALPLIDNNWMVDIIFIGPKGWKSGYDEPSVEAGIQRCRVDGYSVPNTWTTDITMTEGLDTGRWRTLVLSAGRDGEYATGEAADSLTLDALGVTSGKTQDQIVAIIKDRTVDATGSDDLLLELEFEVETPYVRLDPIVDVRVGEPLYISGTTNREPGTPIVLYSDSPMLPGVTTMVEWPTPDQGVFSATIDTSGAHPGSYGLEADDGDGHTDEVAVLLNARSLTAELSVPVVALEDDFKVEGTAKGQTEVTILCVPPKGGGGKSLLDKGEKGLSPRKASVSTMDDTFSKKMTVRAAATAGYYDIYVMCAGMDGEWGMTGEADLEAALNKKYGIPSLTEGVITTKTQAEIENILEDLVMTPGADDLMWKGRLKVEAAYVWLDPIASVGVGEPLVVTGKSNRQEGYIIVVTCTGPVELAPKTVKIENGTFSATFDTTGAIEGEYTVKADDGDGHTDDATVDIAKEVPPSEP